MPYPYCLLHGSPYFPYGSSLSSFVNSVEKVRYEFCGGPLWFTLDAEAFAHHAKGAELLLNEISVRGLIRFDEWLCFAESFFLFQDDLQVVIVNAFARGVSVSSIQTVSDALICLRSQNAMEIVLVRFVLPRIEREIATMSDAGLIAPEIIRRDLISYELLERLKGFSQPEVLMPWRPFLPAHMWLDILQSKCSELKTDLRSLPTSNVDGLKESLFWEFAVSPICLSFVFH
jgi:hypothetical protein